MKEISRRSFHKAAAVSGLTALSASRVYGANERIGVGFIGLGNRGDELLDSFLECENANIMSLCDLNPDYMKFALTKVAGTLKLPKDYRAMLEQKNIDAVVISTPDHWHALQTVDACKAGKDVYVEKPLSLCVAEGRVMVEAAQKHKRVVQVGLQRRSAHLCKDAIKAVQEGAIGHITMCRAFQIRNEAPMGIGSPPDGRPPEKFSWEEWLGPAPMRPYNVNRTFYNFRWFYDYSGGQLTNFGVHFLDFIHWALGHDMPKSVVALGGKFAVQDNREIPDTLEVLWQYPNNTLVSFTQINANSAPGSAFNGVDVEIRGTKGTLYLMGKEYLLVPEIVYTQPLPPLSPINRDAMKAYRASTQTGIDKLKATRKQLAISTRPHVENFLECVKSRKEPNCSIETGHRSTTAALLGRIALQKRALLDWDGAKEQFTNNPEANQLLRYDYRAPHKFPTV